MLNKTLPEHIDPFRYAEQSLRLDGVLSLSGMPRLQASLPFKGDLVEVSLELGIDEQKIVFLKGKLKTMLGLQCQRCMGPLNYEIISDFTLGVVKTLDEANALPALYEPAMVQDGLLALRELVEDELILNLPIIPRHEAENCPVQNPLVESGWARGEGESPFQAALGTLKHKQK